MTQQNIPQARAKIESMKRQFEQKRQIDESLAGIKHKIGVYSGKGGVGKTTVAVNLAATLANDGHTVGILDVDIDCPNVIRAMNISEQPLLDENKKMIPAERFGVKVMSMAYFQENEDEATIWRGPMIHNAINQMLQSTNWGNLEYLIIDMPPGTSDAPLTVMQVLSMDGFVVVTTPQELAKIDAKRSINMIKKLKVNVLGVVENMSGGIFGTGAGKEIATDLDLDFLGAIEIKADYQDTSKPTSLLSNEVLSEYRNIVDNALKSL
jgi:ATP-binding protein involved in chromosome partitioning